MRSVLSGLSRPGRSPTRGSKTKCQLISEPSPEFASTVGRLSTHPWWSSSIEIQGGLSPRADGSRPGRGETRVRVQVLHVIVSQISGGESEADFELEFVLALCCYHDS